MIKAKQAGEIKLKDGVTVKEALALFLTQKPKPKKSKRTKKPKK